MFMKAKKWFENLFREYVLVFSKIKENKTSVKEGISILLTKYNEFCNNIKYLNPKNDYFKPILNEKLKTSISTGKILPLAHIRKDLLLKSEYFCIELYELGIEAYIAKMSKNKIVFNPDDFTESDLQKQKEIILLAIENEDKEFAEKMKKIKDKIITKKESKEAKKLEKEMKNIEVDTSEIVSSYEPSEIVDDISNVDKDENTLEVVDNEIINDEPIEFVFDETLENELNVTKNDNESTFDENLNITEFVDEPNFDEITNELCESNDEIIVDNIENELENEIIDNSLINDEISSFEQESINFDLNDNNEEITTTLEFDPMDSMRNNKIGDDSNEEENEEFNSNDDNEILDNDFNFDDDEIPTIINKYENTNQE